MANILKSKPVLIAGGAAVVNKLMKVRNTKRRRRSKALKVLGGLAVFGTLTSVVKFFRDPLEGPRRRQKIKGFVGKETTVNNDWKPIREQDITIPETTPTPQL